MCGRRRPAEQQTRGKTSVRRTILHVEARPPGLISLFLRTAGRDTVDENAEDGLGMGEDEEELEVERGTVSFGEHAFQFEKFEQVRYLPTARAKGQSSVRHQSLTTLCSSSALPTNRSCRRT